MRNIVIGAALLSVATPGLSAELLANGNFEAGNVGFTSDYRFQAAAAGALSDAGTYTVGTDAGLVNANFASFGDVNTGTGRYLIANGGVPGGSTIWRSPIISVNQGTEYLFKGALATATAGQQARIDIYYAFDGGAANILGTANSSTQAGDWFGLEARFLTTGTLLNIFIVNRETTLTGNGIALDNLRIIGDAVAGPPSTIPEPDTWGLMAGGLGLVGAAVRRRRRNRVMVTVA